MNKKKTKFVEKILSSLNLGNKIGNFVYKTKKSVLHSMKKLSECLNYYFYLFFSKLFRICA